MLKIHNQLYMRLVKWLLEKYPKVWHQYEDEKMGGKRLMMLKEVKDENIIKRLKQDIYQSIKEFMFKELFNHRKAKEGIISAHNQLLDDANRMLLEWSKSDLSYLDLRIKGKGFEKH